MAMMYVLRRSVKKCSWIVLAQHLLLVFPMERRKGTCSLACDGLRSLEHHLPALFWPSISVERTCELHNICMHRWHLTQFISRVCEVALNGDKTFSLRQQKYRVTEALKTGEATALFGAYSNRSPHPSR
jgi:hypothetical protein